MERLWVVLVLASLVTAGCLGIAGEEAEDVEEGSVARPAGQAQGPTGTIRGVVTDEAIQPLKGANVSLLELNVTATTKEDGGFTLAGIPTGTYEIRAGAKGHLPARQQVEVQEDAVASVDFILTTLTEELPFNQKWEVAGFMEYGWGLGWNLTNAAPGGNFWVRDTNCDYDQVAGPLCRGEFEMEPPLETVVFEMAWEPATPLAQEMLAMLRVSDNASVITGEWEMFSVEGESPLYYKMEREEIDAVMANFTQRCEDGEDQYCGLNFRDQGWPLQTRVWPGWKCPVDQIGFCATLEQTYTQYVTAFYYEPAPVGYAIIEGNGPAE